jgi:hypothetical protein
MFGRPLQKTFVVLSNPIHCASLHMELPSPMDSLRTWNSLPGANRSIVTLRRKFAAEIVVGPIAAGKWTASVVRKKLD